MTGSYERLDVGCGFKPHGDVNCDLHVEKTVHRLASKPLKVRSIRNFVKADALHLPFRDNSFRQVFSQWVIEHVDNPVRMVKELVRVCRFETVIMAPHRYSHNSNALWQGHKHTFNAKWFNKLAEHLGVLHEVLTVRYRYFPSDGVGIRTLPMHLKVTIWKNG